MLLRAKRIRLALLLAAIALGFVVNMAFVIVSRTAMVTMPIMLAVFALMHLRWRTSRHHPRARRLHLAARGLDDLAAIAAGPTETFIAGLSALQGAKRSDIDRVAA